MGASARDVMQSRVHTVGPETTIPDLERAFLRHRVSGLPVVERGRLVGLVSRSDVVRQLSLEESRSEILSDYYHDLSGFREDPPESLEAVAARAGARVARLRVADLMSRELICAEAGDAVEDVARVLVQHAIHRVPVVEEGRLVGIVSSLDLVRLLAEGRAHT